MAFKRQLAGVTEVQDLRIKNISDRKSNINQHQMEELKSFAEDTSLHGARFLFAKNVFRRLFWAMAMVACLSYCGYQVCICVIEFYNRPFNTKYHTSAEHTKFYFPAVTLCNLNTFNTRRTRQLLSGYNHSRERVERLLKDTSLLRSGSKEALNEEFIQRSPELFLRQEMASYDPMGWLSHQIEEMILPSTAQFQSCEVNGKHCNASNFTSIRNFMYGYCFTFNSAEGGNSLLHVSSAGQNSGLKLRLNVERGSYLENQENPFVGLAILVHDQKAFPSVEEFGIKIQPGVSTSCAIKRRKIINLEKPYATNCTKRTLDVFTGHSYTAYTKEACLLKCRNDKTIKACGCTSPEFKADPSVLLCSANDTVFCVYRSHEEFGASKEKEECEMDCPEPCEQVKYTTSCSYSGLHRETLIEHFLSLFNGTEKLSVDRAIYEPLLNMTRAEKEKYIDDNIVSLNIYFEDLSYNIIEQTPLYQIWALIGNLGGTFGLFLGMSFLTLLEFLDFTFRKVSYLFHRKRSSRATDVENGLA